MTNLLNVLKTMETETTGVKNDVINFLLAQSQDSEDAEGILDNILTHGCQVNHLIYYKDTVKYFEDHENEIIEMLEIYGIENVESWEGIQELSDMFPQLDSADTRHQEAEEEVREKAEGNVIDYYGADWYSMDDVEQEDAITLEMESICMYENNPMELNTQDKNYLAWAIFEYEAVNLENELSEMELIE